MCVCVCVCVCMCVFVCVCVEGGGGHLLVIFGGRNKWVTSKTILI